MTSYHLTNGLCAELIKLPVWTTEEDRRRALTYTDLYFTGAQEVITAVREGKRGPANLGVIIAAARYQDAGWMPDGSFEYWRRWTLQGTERLNTSALIQWLDFHERDMQQQLQALETRLMIQCREQDAHLAMAQDAARRAHQHLDDHRQAQILARLTTERSKLDTAGTENERAKLDTAHAENERAEPKGDMPDAACAELACRDGLHVCSVADLDAANTALAASRAEHIAALATIAQLQALIAQHERSADDEWKTFNAAKSDREEWRRGYHAMTRERDAAHAERDAAHAERDAAHAERDAAHAERDAAHAERDAAHAERDAAHAAIAQLVRRLYLQAKIP